MNQKVQQALMPKTSGHISYRSNSSMFYKNDKKSIQPQLITRQIKKNSCYGDLKLEDEASQKSVDSRIQSSYQTSFNYKKIQLDKTYDRQHRRNQLNTRNIPSEIKSQLKENYQKIEQTEFQSDHEKTNFEFQQNADIIKMIRQLTKIQKNQDKQEQLDIQEDLQSLNPISSDYYELQSVQSVNFSQQKLQLEKSIDELLKCYPQLTLEKIDRLNPYYLAHMIKICECFSCECCECKCPFVQNSQPYYIMSMKTTNESQFEKRDSINTNLNCKFEYDTNLPMHTIDLQTKYQNDYKSLKRSNNQADLVKSKTHRSNPGEGFFNKSQYKSSFFPWNKQISENLHNLQNLQVQHELENNKKTETSYQQAFKTGSTQLNNPNFNKFTKDPQIWRKKQPFDYVTENQNLTGRFNPKSKIYRQVHKLQNYVKNDNMYDTVSKKEFIQKYDKTLQCPSKQKKEYETIRQLIAERLQL